ncbi:SDR family NAD(P)-dependent oxidoreductase [Chloroflexota bacterium]
MSIPMFSFVNNVAVITGGRMGIGKAIALALAEAGADVVVSDLVVEGGELEAVAEQIRGLGQRSLALQTDIGKKADVDNMVRRVMEEFGRIDVLVNNAAIRSSVPLLELSEDEWDEVIDTDLKGYFFCCQAAGKIMVKQKKGNIISMSSKAAIRVGQRGGNVYGIAKAGVIMLTRALAQELASYNIRVNAIAPSTVRTDFTRNLWSNPERLDQYVATVPLGRIAEASDIVGATLYLASDASSYITGQTIVVDGGSSG